MVEVKTPVVRRVKTTVTLTPEQAADIVRAHLQAPANAEVDFYCGVQEWLQEVTVTWEVVEETDG